MIDKFGYNMSLKNKIVMCRDTWNLSHQIKEPYVGEEEILRENYTIFCLASSITFLYPHNNDSLILPKLFAGNLENHDFWVKK